MLNLKIKEIKTLSLTSLVFKNEIKKDLSIKIWNFLYKIFVLESDITMSEFKKDFFLNVFLRLPIFLMIVFWFIFTLQILGGQN